MLFELARSKEKLFYILKMVYGYIMLLGMLPMVYGYIMLLGMLPMVYGYIMLLIHHRQHP